MLKSNPSYNLNKENRKYLVSELNKLCEFLDNTYDINSGGCCYISYLIAKKLEEFGIKYKLVIFDSEFDSNVKTKDLKEAIQNKNLYHIGCGDLVSNHYAIIVDNMIINGGRYENDPNRKVTVLSKDIQWIYKTGDWNESYNIRLNTILKSYINTLFNAFKIELL